MPPLYAHKLVNHDIRAVRMRMNRRLPAGGHGIQIKVSLNPFEDMLFRFSFDRHPALFRFNAKTVDAFIPPEKHGIRIAFGLSFTCDFMRQRLSEGGRNQALYMGGGNLGVRVMCFGDNSGGDTTR